MALRLVERAGRPVLRSERLASHGVPHAFGTRHGGVSQGPYASNNMSVFNDDDREAVLSNWAGLRQAAGLEEASSQHLLRQVHGAELVEVEPPQEPLPFHHEGAADGLATRTPGLALGIITADCVPVFLYFEARDEAPAEVAALHCGWRSTLAELLPRTLARRPEPPAVLCLGPHIRQDHFEVGPELRSEFSEATPRPGSGPGRGTACWWTSRPCWLPRRAAPGSRTRRWRPGPPAPTLRRACSSPTGEMARGAASWATSSGCRAGMPGARTYESQSPPYPP